MNPREKNTILSLLQEGSTVELSKNELELFLPHRRNALKIDRVIYDPSDSARIHGYKFIHENDRDLDGHFDGNAVYRGTDIAECANLVATMLVLLRENISGYPTVTDFHCSCKRKVSVGDEITITLAIKNRSLQKGAHFFNFEYSVFKAIGIGKSSKLVAIGEITGTAT